MQKNVSLHFSNQLVDKPIVSTLVRKYDVDVNILSAIITPNEEGKMFVQMKGEEEKLQQALGYLVAMGVDVVVKPKGINFYEDICVSCGACTVHCLPKALSVDEETKQIVYSEDLCIACELCIPACPYGAVELIQS